MENTDPKMYDATFRVIKSARLGTIRDQEVRGLTFKAPTVGFQFVLLGDGRDTPDSVRRINTSPVTKVTQHASFATEVNFTFETKSGSVYWVTIYDFKVRPWPSQSSTS